MKNTKNMKQFKSILLVLIVMTAFGCKRDNNTTGYAYFPDMAYSNAFETWGSSPNYSDSVTMLLPVEGTVPRGMIPYQYTKSFDEQQRAGRELISPVEANTANLLRGKAQYDIYCAMCHGDKGQGNGHLFTSKLFPVQPTSLVGDYVQNKPDGEIYHVITLGSLSGLMGAHGSLIKPDDRWKIIAYVKNGFTAE